MQPRVQRFTVKVVKKANGLLVNTQQATYRIIWKPT